MESKITINIRDLASKFCGPEVYGTWVWEVLAAKVLEAIEGTPLDDVNILSLGPAGGELDYNVLLILQAAGVRVKRLIMLDQCYMAPNNAELQQVRQFAPLVDHLYTPSTAAQVSLILQNEKVKVSLIISSNFGLAVYAHTEAEHNAQRRGIKQMFQSIVPYRDSCRHLMVYCTGAPVPPKMHVIPMKVFVQKEAKKY